MSGHKQVTYIRPASIRKKQYHMILFFASTLFDFLSHYHNISLNFSHYCLILSSGMDDAALVFAGIDLMTNVLPATTEFSPITVSPPKTVVFAYITTLSSMVG